MRKLALSDEILLQVEKPARYIGNEVNAVMKDKDKVDVRFCMCFPDVYEIGMSHLGIQILYDMFNRREDIWCERVYSPWTDLDRIIREQKIPLFALESQDPLKDFDFIGITIQYEMCYTNILQVLDLGQIQLLARDRSDGDPIVIGGGPCASNPEPLADFFDMFYIGEGETVYFQLMDLYKEYRSKHLGRNAFLRQAGMLYRPLRERRLSMLKEYAAAMLKNTGHEEISLSSLSSSDYSDLEGIVNFLIEEFQDQGVNISLPSLRIDAFSLDVMSKVQDVRKSSLTFAPEAGSQRLRDVINKGLTEEVILEGAGEAFAGGWSRVKLYFMLGLPTETEEDMKGIAHLAEKIAKRYYEIPKDQRNGKCQITVSTSFFVPKPFTPFQWVSMNSKEDFLAKAKIVNQEIKEQLNKKSIKYNWHEADVSVLEGVLARGDRRVGASILRAYEKGSLYDAWGENFDNELWMSAFRETGVDPDFYTCRVREESEILPWDFIDVGVTKKFLWREWQNAQAASVTKNCRQGCSGCGAKTYGGGVCYEG